MAIDRNFGSSGSIWSGVPTEGRDYFGGATGTFLLGGTAVGMALDPAGPIVLVEGLRPGALEQMTRVVAVRFPTDGHPAEVGRWDGALVIEVSTGGWATALATCQAPAGGAAVLLRELMPPAYTLAGARYAIRVATYSQTTAGISAEIPLTAAAIFDTHGPVAVRLVPDGSGYVAVSTEADRVRIAAISAQGDASVAPTIRLGGPGTALPGLTRLGMSSIRVDGRWLSIAFTAYLQHPGIGASTVGGLLRVDRSGAPDPLFGDDGVWVSPLTNQIRNFLCASEFPGGIVGIQGTDVLAFGIAPGGADLNDPFAESGILQQTLGGGLSSPVTADDGSHTFLFARRQDGRMVGCRFDRQGTLDPTFGAAGISTVASDGAPATPSALSVTDGRITLAATRQVEGWDCDRLPELVVLDAATGRPDATFGAGGFALHSAVGRLAAIGPDGSCTYVERGSEYIGSLRADVGTMTLRRANADGNYERAAPLATPGVTEPMLWSLQAPDDGSLLVGGLGSPGWIAKLSRSGAPDSAFGTSGLSVPRPGVQGAVRVLGVRVDGRIAIQFESFQGIPGDRFAIALLEADGSLDTTYAIAGSGFITLSGKVVLPTMAMPDPVASTVAPFLDTDGSVLCALATNHQFLNDPFVQFGLRRITPTGEYDAVFGVGVPSLARPAPGRLISLTEPAGATGARDAYSQVSAVGCAWMGGKLYVVAAGVAGGVFTQSEKTPAYRVLLVSRWNSDGTIDLTFGAGGFQEAGFDPERVEFAPVGVIPRSSSELLVYGQAGRVESRSITVGATTYTSKVIRRREPAIFSVRHPGGIDTGFGRDDADVMPIQEFQADMLAARLLPALTGHGGERLRFVCTDTQNQPVAPKAATSTFGGVGQFFLVRRRPPLHIP